MCEIEDENSPFETQPTTNFCYVLSFLKRFFVRKFMTKPWIRIQIAPKIRFLIQIQYNWIHSTVVYCYVFVMLRDVIRRCAG